MSILKRINGERTIYSLFHLLQGKRSSQTIQDAHLYKITAYFHTYPSVTREGLEKMISRLLHRGLVEEIADSKVILTGKGEAVLDQQLSEYKLPDYLNGWKYHQVTGTFWERLTLLIQVSSNLINHERSFIPVRNKRDTLTWVKQYIKQQNEDRYKLAERLYVELISALDNPNVKPELVVLRLTGYRKIGLTTLQAAEWIGLEPAHYHFEFLNCLHAMFDKVLENSNAYPLLNGLIKKPERNVPLTISTDKTYKLMLKGYALEEIAAVRNLKQSTIEDHVVEIALSIKGFNIDDYVPLDKRESILQTAQRNSAKKLKQIKEHVADASYFEIRLVLAKYGDVEWS
ncbi:helix-turn-helix domain-containing protein [Mesobacillus subterraneus]|uniref:helix-turn-helix domain-containing protein n=1 Tax=Mesobacillus subterraneus TaxID=285983 RepID=UPI001CFDCEAF|nr:helix-turn-helix domain-containing protein [Mesobacillus subterraneus]WLR56500.1 helix-turn-helix domain-containing protein [Mesobacillus subterraneus]